MYDEMIGVRSVLPWMNPRRVPSAAYTTDVAPGLIGLSLDSSGALAAML